MKWTLDKQLFAGLGLIVFLFNLTLLVDIAWIFEGAETRMANDVLISKSKNWLSSIYGLFSNGNPLDLSSYRIPSIMALLLGITGILWLSYPLLGKAFLLPLFLVIINNYTLVFLAKVGTADTWIFTTQTLALLSIIRFLKKPHWSFRVMSYLMMILALMLHPLSSCVIFLVIPGLWYIFHPQGKALWSLNPWSVVALSLLGLYFTDQLHWLIPTQYLGWGSSHFLLFLGCILVGLLPLLGFTLAGFQASFKNIRKQEDFSLLFIPWLIIALLAQSSSVIAPLVILTAKHLQDYLLEQYPYRNIVRIYSTLHLIFFFFLAAFLMLGGFFIFRGAGFRSGLAFSSVYWMLSFVLVIGLYGINRRFIYTGGLLIGLLTTTLFCLQVFPLLENQRIVRKVVETIEENRWSPDWIEYREENLAPEADNLRFYLENQTNASVLQYGPEAQNARGVILEKVSNQDTSSTTVLGWYDHLEAAAFKMDYLIQGPN